MQWCLYTRFTIPERANCGLQSGRTSRRSAVLMATVSLSVITARSSSQQLAGQAPRTCATTSQSAPPPPHAVLGSAGSLLCAVSSKTKHPLRGGMVMAMPRVRTMTTREHTLIKNSVAETLCT
uniref:Uncharacterized protein n=1 Tax=Arundo donax TaxID=35708 RepID=A0A0A9CNE4_ARUDO